MMKKTFYVVKQRGINYLVPDKKAKKVTSLTPHATGTLVGLLSDKTKKIEVFVS